MKSKQVEPDLEVDLENWAVHYIELSGKSTDPVIGYYYGTYRVIMKRTPAAASDALACFKCGLNVPKQDQQNYTVYDIYGNVIDYIEPSTLFRFPQGWEITRRSFSEPLRPSIKKK